MRHCRDNQKGAALVLTIAMVGVAVLAWQHRASLSQLLMAQHVLEQSTMAASLAAAQHHARLLNAHAYLNRTTMAHQVAMAHLMTIASVEKMRREMARRVMRGNPPLFLIGMMFGPHHAAAYAASRVSVAGTSLSGVRQLHEAFKRHNQALTHDLVKARQALLHGMREETYAVVQAVLARNIAGRGSSPRLEVQIDLPDDRLGVKLMDPTDKVWRQWFDQTISEQSYLNKRRDTARNWWMINPECPHMRHELRRRGESSFEANGLWQVTDTLSFHAVRGKRIILCYWREYPMGFANLKSAAKGRSSHSALNEHLQSLGPYPEDFRKMTFLRWFTSQFALTAMFHGFSNGLADGWGYSSRVSWRAHASPEVYRHDPKLKQLTKVRVRQVLQNLSDPVLHVGLRIKGLLSLQPDWSGALTAEASAEAYFDRYEPRRDGQSENPSLFQPFWMARNVVNE
jgi:hypothetical protein